MDAAPLAAAKLTSPERRRSMAAAYAHGALLGLGNGLASTTLVVYVAYAYGAGGKETSWLLATPAFVGLTRLAAPLLIARFGSRRRFCQQMYLWSACALATMPVLTAPHVMPTSLLSLAALVASWSLFHVYGYLGDVALWSWFGDLAPRRIRGRFIGRRQAWTNAGMVLGTVLAVLGVYYWHDWCERTSHAELEWRSYAICGAVGAMAFALSLWPLSRIADVPAVALDSRPSTFAALGKQIITPFADARFRKLLLVGAWYAVANGLVESAQWMFQTHELQLSFVQKKSLDAGSRSIQSILMPWAGAAADRYGNVLVLVLSLGILALAPLFLLIADAGAPFWILGAYLCWLAYAGVNTVQPNLMLGLSPSGETAGYASAWFAWTQLSYSLSVLLGGYLYDWLADHFEEFEFGDLQIDDFALLFLLSWALKSLAVLWATRVPEPDK